MYSVSSTTQYVVIDLDRDSRDGAQAETASAFYLPKHLSSQQGFNFLQWNLLAWIINLLGFLFVLMVAAAVARICLQPFC